MIYNAPSLEIVDWRAGRKLALVPQQLPIKYFNKYIIALGYPLAIRNTDAEYWREYFC